MKGAKERDIFMKGAIPPAFIADSIAKHSAKRGIGAHSIFLGQVRADRIGDATVTAIEYTAHEVMANERMAAIREEVFAEFGLTCMHVHHSLGNVAAGEVCLFVFTSSPHRKAATEACSRLVERIKAELPVWGREVLDDLGHHWKKNT